MNKGKWVERETDYNKKFDNFNRLWIGMVCVNTGSWVIYIW